jgi:hypothetical protein
MFEQDGCENTSLCSQTWNTPIDTWIRAAYRFQSRESWANGEACTQTPLFMQTSVLLRRSTQ